MYLDEIDKIVLNENFDQETIEKLDKENVAKIYLYLINNKVYYAKDLFLSSLDLFLLPFEEFKNKFEKLKLILGADFVEKLGKDTSLIDIMY